MCFYPNTVKKVISKTVLARKFDIRYSSIKLNACAMIVRKAYINDALGMIENSNKKGAKMIAQLLNNAKSIARQQGLSDTRLYVKECIVGKALG